MKKQKPWYGPLSSRLRSAYPRYARANKRARRGLVGLHTHVGGLLGQHILSLLLLAADRPNNRQSTAKLYENRLPPPLSNNRKAAPLTGKLRAAGIIKDCRGGRRSRCPDRGTGPGSARMTLPGPTSRFVKLQTRAPAAGPMRKNHQPIRALS
jgi:hypothetical protein